MDKNYIIMDSDAFIQITKQLSVITYYISEHLERIRAEEANRIVCVKYVSMFLDVSDRIICRKMKEGLLPYDNSFSTTIFGIRDIEVAIINRIIKAIKEQFECLKRNNSMYGNARHNFGAHE